ncbi:insulin-like receptor isoform X2 [Prorops nasuta]|uniref:insulin-like receptor isoform X2 n=1 Tax=Prorops nasuta TaxID=863751 RepID=UPI0034CD058B
MKTSRLLLIVVAILAIFASRPLAQPKKWSSSKHLEKTIKSKFDLAVGNSDDALEYSFRNHRAIDKSSSTGNGSAKSTHQSQQSSNLPKSRGKPSEDPRIPKGRRYMSPVIREGICHSVDIRNNVNYFRILKDCQIIEGFLQIVLMENNTEADFQNISFPNLREITGYLLVYRISGLKTLANLFPNLEVIRGDILFTDYAFMVYEMNNIKEIGLSNLTEISRGGVRIEKNPSLCYTNTLDWSIIVKAGENVIKDNGHAASCPGCSQCPGGYCWTAKHCQMREKPKCHEQCLGECHGPTEKDCYVCKHYRHEGKCMEHCPIDLYAYLSRRCIRKEECIEMNKVRKFKFDDEQVWRPFNGSCIVQCPDGLEDYIDKNNVTTCKKCEGRCRKIGKGAIIRHISDAQSFRGTTIVKGALEFQIRNGNPNIMNELTDAFGLIEEITEYVKVTHSFPITSLYFFKKLRVIKGEKLDINNASLVVLDNPNLSNLFPPDQKLEIKNGRLFFHYNPKLCLNKIDELGRMVGITNFTNLEVQAVSNGEKVACVTMDINLRAKEIGSDYVNLNWDSYKAPERQQLLSYVLNYIETENENITYEANACGNNNWQMVDVDVPNQNSSFVSKLITELKPYTKYAAYVKTFSAMNDSLSTNSRGKASQVGQSEIMFFRTRSDIPSTPINVVSSSLSSSEISVKWDPPERPNGPISYYMISGFLRPDDKEFLSSRDYCKDSLVPDSQVDETQEIAIKTTVVNPSSCCSKDTAAKTVSMKKFDIFCHENITLSYVPAEKKDYCVFNKYNDFESEFDRLAEDSMEKSRGAMLNLDDSLTRIVNGVYHSFVFNVSASNNSYIIDKLRHYSLYTISVAACGTKSSNREMCSSVQYTNTRTDRRRSADNVPNVKVEVFNNTIVDITWDTVPNPNSLTVAYVVEYTNLDVRDAKKSTDCIPYSVYVEKRNAYSIKHLSPGKYSLRMRSTSLAGDGDFSELIYFSVGLKEDNSTIIIALLIFATLAATVMVAYLFFRSRSKRKQQERLIANVNPDYIETQYTMDNWEVERESVEILEELGLGNFGMVYKGCLDKTVMVAIKTISEKCSEREKNEFLNEASVMKNFSTFHIIKLLGVVSVGNPPYVIMELMENGDLKTYLRRIRDTHLVPNASRIIRMAAEIADGMAYLESKKFVHRDLAARNCMVSKDLVCKIGDFGMARDIYETDYYKIGKKGLLPIRWMAPENLSDGVFTSDSDVWSFGVVLYEILTLAEVPYQGLSNEDVLSYVLRKGILNIPRNCPENIMKIMERCFKWRPNDRPTFMEIVAELEPFLGQDFCEKSFYHSTDGVEIRRLGLKKAYHHAAPIRFHWGNETARWVREFEDNVTLLDQTKAGTSRGRIFKNGFQHFGNVTNMEDVPLDR